MPDSTDKILNDLEAEQIRRLNLTREDLQKSYNILEEQNFPDTERIKFIADLGACKEIGYHYELVCKDWEEGKNLRLESSFDKHGAEGLEFLFDRLSKYKDERLRVFTAFLIAEILTKLKHKDFYVHFCDKLIPVLASLIETKDSNLRQKVIIAFGWVGSSEEIDILTRQMLSDNDALCRAWSATSLMQMSFHRVKTEIIKKETAKSFAEAIEAEKDLYSCGIMIEAAQTLFGKKWLSSSAVENKDILKIEKAGKSAIRFLNKYGK